MINKWLRFRMILWRVEHLYEHLFDQLHMRSGFKGAVEGEKWPRVLKAVAGEFQLVGTVDVGDLKLNRGSRRRLARPHKEVSVPPLFEVQQVVARSLVTHLIDDLFGTLTVDLGFRLVVGDHRLQILGQLLHAAGDSL